MIKLAVSVTAALILGACGQTVSEPTTVVNPATTDTRTNTATVRQCTTTLSKPSGVSNDVFAANLANFMGTSVIVSNLEGPATECLTLQKATGSSLTGDLRVEYEDDAGIRYFSTDQMGILYSNLAMTTSNNTATTTLELIFQDAYGLIQVKGTQKGSSTTKMTATVKFYNFLPYADALAQAQSDMAAQCGKTLTYAQCLGYNFTPSFYVSAPLSYQQTQINAAQNLFNTSSHAVTLGSMTFSLANVLTQ